MGAEDRVYVQLQRHLDRQAVGFPATRSKAEIRILKRLFTPRDAEIASHLTYKFEPLDTIYPRVKHLVQSTDELSQVLDAIHKKGGISCRTSDSKRQYCNIPYAVGMFESQLGHLTPEYISDHNEYTGDRKFGVAFLATEVPQMRTIPVAKSISPQARTSTFDEVAVLVQQAAPPFRVFECICRQKKLLEGESCKVTDRKETCLAFGDMAQSASLIGIGREIGRDEVMSVLEMNQKQGLVLEPSNTQKAEFICSCCGCCCGMLALHQKIAKPADFWASNYRSVVDVNACDACGACETRCQVGGIRVAPDSRVAVIDVKHCIGCGLCVAVCDRKALSLQRKVKQVAPPKTREELYDVIMAKKKGTLGKWRLTGKLAFDAITTGQSHLLKSEQPASKRSA